MENSKKAIVILAGGFGSRYRGLKQIDGILPNGATLLEYSLFDALQAGFNKIIFIINKEIPEKYIAKISNILSAQEIEFHWVIQDVKDFVDNPKTLEIRKKPWGTAHAVLCAEKVVAENFVVINADDYYGSEVYRIAANLIDENKIQTENYAAILYPLKNTLSKNGTVSRGKCELNKENKLISIKELTKISSDGSGIFYFNGAGLKEKLQDDTLVSMNYWIFHPSIFKSLKIYFEDFILENPTETQEFFLPAVINDLIEKQKITVAAEVSPEKWKGITYPGDKAELQEFLLGKISENFYKENLWT